MIRILFIVPYPELEPVVKEVYSQYPNRDFMEVDFQVKTVEEIMHYKMTKDYDVLVARNFTYRELKKAYPHMPVIDIPITGYDIVRAVYESKSLYNARKIGMIGNFFKMYGLEDIEEIAQCELLKYQLSHDEGMEELARRAKDDGCDCIIGGYSVYQHVKAQQMAGVTIRVGRETVHAIFDEAYRIAEAVQNEREQAIMLRAITDKSVNGILYINNKKNVVIANDEASELFEQPKAFMEGRNINEISLHLTEETGKVLANGDDRQNRIHRLRNGRMIAADYMPLLVGKEIKGVVISLQSVIKVQQMEHQIRRKLSDKGLQARYRFSNIIYNSDAMEHTIATARKYAAVSSNILIIGETGTGKELVAQSIHNASNRKNEPFIAVNCAALPENLLESELFGYVDGAFTGSKKGGKPGLFELAHKGTLFLDEISEIPLAVQTKLLRVLQEREVRRIGGENVITIDVRIIAATNRNLKAMVEKGNFRQDLLFRLDVLSIYVPPLRVRKGDIEELFYYYLEIYGAEYTNGTPKLDGDALELVKNYDYKGNVRELRNLAERTSVLYEGTVIDRAGMEEILYPQEQSYMGISEENGETFGLPDYREIARKKLHEEAPDPEEPAEEEKLLPIGNPRNEREELQAALAGFRYNRGKTAEYLGIDRSTLWRKMKKYGL